MNNEHSQMVTDLKKPGQDILTSMTPRLASAAHMLTGIYDEHLELLDEIDELERINHEGLHYEETLKNLVLEAGDLVFYLSGLHQDIVGEDLDWHDVSIAAEEYKTYSIGVTIRMMSEDLRSWVIKVATPVKRLIYYNKPLSKGQVSTDIKGMLGILARIVDKCGAKTEEILEANMKKLLGGRYKEGKYTDEQANTRKDENGA